MEEFVKNISGGIATCSEFAAVVAIVIGAIQAIISAVATLIQNKALAAPLTIFRGFAGHLKSNVSRDFSAKSIADR
jgi:hypothetical protein